MESNNNIDSTLRRKLDLSFDDSNKDKEVGSEESPINEDELSNLEKKIPKIGMEFDSEEDAYQFYNGYARAIGFSIRRNTLRKDRNGRIIDRGFCCSCEGFREEDKRAVAVKPRAISRTGCHAMMQIRSRDTTKYKIVKFIENHNHDLVGTPVKVRMLRSHRYMETAHKWEIDDIESSGIAPKAGFSLMAQQAGGRENIGFMFEDYKNYLRTKRTLEMKTGDTGGVLEYLQRRQSDDPKFFYAIQVDRDDKISNILWIDAQMMVDYIHFGDVICFDTTYGKNKDGRPFALFVGVNHHKQTIVFGAALLYDETAETFIWLFDTFAKAMSGKKPITILTDQDAAMSKALGIIWPETCHRLCIWHINQNAATHLSSVFGRFPSFKRDFSTCIYEYDEVEEFLNAWKEMLEKYELQTNDWLQRLFQKKEKWALVYGHQTFCADMITTQRSESMNSSLKRYVSYKHNLLRFFYHFDRLVGDRRYEELKADLKTSNSRVLASLPVEIVKHACSIYTHEVFELFQNEVHKAYDSTIELFGESGETYEYKVTPFEKHYRHTVKYDSSQNTVSCSCRKFEFVGILCSHALKVLSIRNIVKIPELYILKRWTKKAKKNFNEESELGVEFTESVNEKDEKKMIEIRYKELCRLTNQLVTRAASTSETFRTSKAVLLKQIEEVDVSLENRTTTRPSVGSTSLVPQNIVSRSVVDEHEAASHEIIIKGLKNKEKRVKSGKRLKSGLEMNTRKKKQKDRNVSSSCNDIVLESNNQSVKNMTTNMSIGAPIGSNTLSGSQSQLSQEHPVDLYNSNLGYHSEEFAQSHATLFQYAQLTNPVANYQLNLTPHHSVAHQRLINPVANHQLNLTPYHSVAHQHRDNSLTQLLQQQLISNIPQSQRENANNNSGDGPKG